MHIIFNRWNSTKTRRSALITLISIHVCFRVCLVRIAFCFQYISAFAHTSSCGVYFCLPYCLLLQNILCSNILCVARISSRQSHPSRTQFLHVAFCFLSKEIFSLLLYGILYVLCIYRIQNKNLQPEFRP